jgi:hypothetical protein
VHRNFPALLFDFIISAVWSVCRWAVAGGGYQVILFIEHGERDQEIPFEGSKGDVGAFTQASHAVSHGEVGARSRGTKADWEIIGRGKIPSSP